MPFPFAAAAAFGAAGAAVAPLQPDVKGRRDDPLLLPSLPPCSARLPDGRKCERLVPSVSGLSALGMTSASVKSHPKICPPAVQGGGVGGFKWAAHPVFKHEKVSDLRLVHLHRTTMI